MRFLTPVILASAVALTALQAPIRAAESDVYVEDIRFALSEIERLCGHFFESKGIDWKAVSRQFLEEAASTGSDEDHLVQLVRLLARLEDGHARVVPMEKGEDVSWPQEGPYASPVGKLGGPGFFLCRSKKHVFIKQVFGEAAQSGLDAGSEVLEIDGMPVEKWIEQRTTELRDTQSFSTDQQAFYFVCHWGLARPRGEKMEILIKDKKRKKKDKTLIIGKASYVPGGPVAPPEGLEAIGRQSYGKTKRGFGYIHLRDIPDDILEQMDTMLAALGRVPGLILDCRANGGGGCDHDALLGRFVPQGESMQRAQAGPIASTGPNPYGGNMVVIVDAGVRSAGETVSGMFKEDGRAYMIGESPTAGMSSSKETIELPSQLFGLFVSIRSNKSRFQDGRGIEGVGIEPHEIVEYEPKELAAEGDTLLRRAEEILMRFPEKKVPYKPKRHGWK